MTNASSDLRLFIAVPLSDEIRLTMARLMNDWKPMLSFQKWVHAEDLHITLKFLGDTSPQTAEKIKQQLQQIAEAQTQPIRLSLQGLGTFGKPSAPSILWAGVHGDIEALSALHTRVEASMLPLGFEREDRAYRPHLTLARRYQGEDGFPKQKLQQIAMPASLTWTADRMVLYQSHLNRTPMYEEIEAFRVAGPFC